MAETPELMRAPRRPRLISRHADAWYYIDFPGIDVYVQIGIGRLARLRITRKQMERALEIIAQAEEDADGIV